MAQPYGLVIEVHVNDFNLPVFKTFDIHAESMVLGRDTDAVV